jgi:hypothetical protein
MKSHYPSIAVTLVLTTVVWIYFYSKDEPLNTAETVAAAAVTLALLFLGKALYRRIRHKSPSSAIPRTKDGRMKENARK